MIIKNWKKEIFTIPNLLSLLRLLLIPVYVNIYLKASEQKDYLLAGFVLAVSCLTDMFDGKLARKLNMVSNFGKLLDPMADKLTQLAITVCLTASLGISLYAMFIGLLMPNLTNNYKLGGLVVLTALCNTLLSQVIDSSWALIISTLLCAFIGVFFVDLDEWSVCWQPSPPIFFYTYLFNRNHT